VDGEIEPESAAPRGFCIQSGSAGTFIIRIRKRIIERVVLVYPTGHDRIVAAD